MFYDGFGVDCYEIDTKMNGTENKLSSQEDLDGYEDAGSGMAYPILHNNEGHVDRKN